MNEIMKIVYKAGNRDAIGDMNFEAREAVEAAIALVEGRQGFRTQNERWWHCELVITIGHNIYTTQIHLQPVENEVKARERRGGYYDSYAMFSNGAFWANVSRQKVALI